MIKGYKCYHCGGDTEPDVVDHEARWGEQRVLVRGVPVLRCVRCHELFFEPAVLDVIKKIAREEPKPGEPEIVIRMPVRSYEPVVNP